MSIEVHNDWQAILTSLSERPSYQQLRRFLAHEYQTEVVYPSMDRLFRAFQLTSYKDVKVCILGQDPYHGEGQANGLAFSVAKDQALPPSLKNIYKELEDDLHQGVPKDGDLSHWAKQGVLLLNTVLSVRAQKAHSHRQQGWEEFTDGVICALNARIEPIIFVLWGNPARAKKKLIDGHHYIIEAPHPSPLSAHRGFFGSKPFSKVNAILKELGEEPIDWVGGKS